MSNDLIIRPALKEDAELIAKVITMAINTDEGNQLFPVFCELASREFSQYSYHNCLVAEVDALPVGAIVGYDGARLSELREPIFELIDKYIGKSIVIEDETQPGEFYVDSFAVFQEWRGKGLGKQLLLSMMKKAASDGHKRVGLLVDQENPRAEKLYQSLGFRVVEEKMFLGHPMWHMICGI